MASEKLTIELQAKTNQLDAKLKSVDTQLNELGDSADNTDTKFKKISNSASTFGKALGVASVAVTALTAGTVALIKQTTAYGRELKIASNISGVSTERLQSMAFATSTVGIGLEKLGDISKDTREKIGDFLNTGGGGFMDFVDAMKLTKEEATAVAKEFSTMAGPDILQEMVNRMEEAEVSAVQMSHALEGMASDTTNLIPLLSDGGKKAKELADGMSGVTVPLTAEDLKKLEDMDVALNLAGEAATNLATKSLVKLSDWFVNAANAASFFFASLNEGTRADLQTDLLPILDSIKEVEQKLQTAGGAEENRLNRLLEKLKAEREEIRLALDALNNTAEAPALISTGIVEGGDDASEKEQKLKEWLTRQEELEAEAAENKKQREAEATEAQRQRQIEDIENRWLTEEEKLHEKYEKELEIIGEHNENKLALEDEYLQNLIDLDEAREAEKNKTGQDALKNTEKRLKTEQKLEMQNAKSIMSIMSSLVDSDSAAGKILFLGSQALALAETFVNTKAASIKALTIDPTGILSAKIEVAGALNMAAIAAASIGGVAGGSGGGSTISGGGSIQRPEPIEPDFVQDTGALQLTDSSANSSQVIRIELATDSGDPITVALVEAINKGQREGVF
mgnify:CR=1 FL=1